MRLLALDQGTSATKALVVEDDGSVLAEAEVAVEVSTGAGGSVEVDPEDLWSSVVEAGRQAVAMAGVDVDGVGLANQGETVLAWEPATGRPCSAGIVWQDRRSAPICERIAAAGGAERLTAITGLELDPYFVAPKMVWLQKQLEAAELAHMGPGRVVVVERDQEPAGIPRHANHTGFGLGDLRRLLSGPAYASRLVDRAVAEGADVRCGTSALGWEAVRTTLSVLEPGSPASPWPARAVILATGTRERPRSARLVPGDRPADVLTTGALQQQSGPASPSGAVP
jgi:hypothetical protein